MADAFAVQVCDIAAGTAAVFDVGEDAAPVEALQPLAAHSLFPAQADQVMATATLSIKLCGVQGLQPPAACSQVDLGIHCTRLMARYRAMDRTLV